MPPMMAGNAVFSDDGRLWTSGVKVELGLHVPGTVRASTSCHSLPVPYVFFRLLQKVGTKMNRIEISKSLGTRQARHVGPKILGLSLRLPVAYRRLTTDGGRPAACMYWYAQSHGLIHSPQVSGTHT
eukprot:scaffold163085_cov43-Attheya_sp.AAC.1